MGTHKFYGDHKNGRNHWYIWIGGFLLIWLFSHLIPLTLEYLFLDWWRYSGLGLAIANSFDGEFPSDLFIYMASSLPFILGLWLIQCKIRQRPLWRLNNARGEPGFRWKRVWAGVLVFAAVMAFNWGIISLISYLNDFPSPAEQIGFPKKTSHLDFFVPGFRQTAIIAAIILLPVIALNAWLQEAAFRGLIDQGLSRYIRQPLAVFLISAFFFALWHIRPEDIMDYYNFGNRSRFYIFLLNMMSFGFLMSILTSMDRGIEAAVGLHLANNFYYAFLAAPHAYAIYFFGLGEKLTGVQTDLIDLLEVIIFYILALTLLAYWQFGLKTEKPKDG